MENILFYNTEWDDIIRELLNHAYYNIHCALYMILGYEAAELIHS